LSDQIEKKKNGRGMWNVWGLGEVHTGLFWGDLREGNHLEDPGLDGLNLQEVGLGVTDWFDLAYDRDCRWTLVNAVMNLRVPQNLGNFLTS
jgi:hypothetical protein